MQLEVWKKPKQESSRGEASGSRGGEGGWQGSLRLCGLRCLPFCLYLPGMTVT